MCKHAYSSPIWSSGMQNAEALFLLLFLNNDPIKNMSQMQTINYITSINIICKDCFEGLGKNWTIYLSKLSVCTLWFSSTDWCKSNHTKYWMITKKTKTFQLNRIGGAHFVANNIETFDFLLSILIMQEYYLYI